MAASRLPRRTEAWLRISAVAAAVLLLGASVAVGASVYQGTLLLLFVGVLAHAASFPLALVRPRWAAPLSIVGLLVVMFSAQAGSPWPWAVTTIVTQALVLAALGYRAVWALGTATLVVAVAASGLLAGLLTTTHDPEAVAVNLVVFASIGGTTLAAGVVLREWVAIRLQLARERQVTEEERARRMLAEEKTRIARELHDVIAHSMSIITVQATSAAHRHPQADAELRREFDEIAASSRRALSEMRSLLGVLRDPEAPVPHQPQPRLSDIAELVAQSQRSGLKVDLEGADALTDDGVDDAIGLTAYRIVQEALSNVIRHAPGAAAVVRAHRGDRLEITVSNGGGRVSRSDRQHGHPPDTPGSGLRGMRERAASAGGTLSSGPTDGGGFEVRATLPLRSPEDPAGTGAEG